MSAATEVASKPPLPRRLQLCDVWSLRRAQFLLVIATVAAFALIFTANAPAAEPKRVLLIHSFGSATPPFTVESTAFETELVREDG